MILTALCQSAAFGPWRNAGIGALGAVLLLCAVETTRQSLIWQEQHERTEQFFGTFEAAGLLETDEVYLANVPFGYKSAFMFSFESLEDALEQRFGSSPDIHFLSYMNMGDTTQITTTLDGNQLEANIQVTAYSFYLLPPAQRRAPGPIKQGVGGW